MMAEPELTERQAFLVLNALPNIGPITTNRLLTELGGDPRAIFAAAATRLEAVKGVGPAIVRTIAQWETHFDLAREERRLADAGATFVTTRDDGYPKLLRQIHDPPIGLYRRGGYAFDQPCIAVVGSRRPTLYGQAVARKLGADLAERGFGVVSGLARGIDTAAHEGALSVGGHTAAVLGNGLDIIYPPENLDLYRRISETGAVLAEFPFGRRADRQSFAMRNRIVSGICEAVVVVESDVDGGAMITARFAGEPHRPGHQPGLPPTHPRRGHAVHRGGRHLGRVELPGWTAAGADRRGHRRGHCAGRPGRGRAARPRVLSWRLHPDHRRADRLDPDAGTRAGGDAHAARAETARGQADRRRLRGA